MATEITERNQDIELIAEAVHRLDHRTAAMAADLAHLRRTLDEFAPLLATLKTGGLLAARRAARANGGSKT